MQGGVSLGGDLGSGLVAWPSARFEVAFSCTVVSTTISVRSESFMAFVFTATARLSCSSAFSRSSPMGGDGERARKLVETFRPFMWSLFLELTSIVCFGYALSHARPTTLEPPTKSSSIAQARPAQEAQPTQVKAPVIPTVKAPVIPSVKTPVIPSVKTVLTPAKAKAVALKVVGGTHQVVSDDQTVLRSKVASWVESLPLGQTTPISQRDLAAQLGCSQKSVQKGLTVVSNRKVARVVSTSSGTVVTRLR